MKFDITKVTKENVGQYIELLSPTVRTEEEALSWCDLAKKYNCRTHLSEFIWLPLIVEYHKKTGIKVGGGVTFPYGTETPATKAKAVEELLKIGVDDIDYSMNFQALLAGRDDMVKEELRLFAELTKGKIETKLIIEAAMLETEDNIRKACDMAMDQGIDWIKTASGQMDKVLTINHVAVVLDEIKGTDCRCKVSGIKAPRAQNAYLYLMAGAEAIGTKSVKEVVEGLDTLRALGLLPAYKG